MQPCFAINKGCVVHGHHVYKQVWAPVVGKAFAVDRN